MNRFRILLSLFVIIGAVVFGLRHRSLKQLQNEQTQLREQTDQRSTRPATTPPADTSAPSTNVNLSETERLELLRLRGQIGQLRRDLTQATNRPASAPQRSTAPSGNNEPTVSRSEAMQRVATSRQWSLALIMYAQSHQGQLPSALSEVGSRMPADAAGDFELAQSGALNAGPATRTILLREKQPWKGTNGRWQRVYAFADGHTEMAQSDTADFTQWEEEVKTRSD